MSDFNKIEKNNINVLSPFKLLVLQNFPFIEADFDAITNYQLMCKMAEYMNNINSNVNTLNENENRVYNAFNEIVDYINNYFNNLDVQDEINNKLDDLVNDGTLTNLIKIYVNNSIQPQIDYQNNEINNIKSQITSIGNNSPIPVSNANQMTDTTKIYVLSTDGNWYYYNGSEWSVGGTYQSQSIGIGEVAFNNLNEKLSNDLYLYNTDVSKLGLKTQNYATNSWNTTNPIFLKKGTTITVSDSFVTNYHWNLRRLTSIFGYTSIFNETTDTSYTLQNDELCVFSWRPIDNNWSTEDYEVNQFKYLTNDDITSIKYYFPKKFTNQLIDLNINEIINNLCGASFNSNSKRFYMTNNRASITKPIKSAYPIKFHIIEGYKFGVTTWTQNIEEQNGTYYIADTGWLTTDYIIPANTYFMFTISKADDTNLTGYDLSSLFTMCSFSDFTYTNNKIAELINRVGEYNYSGINLDLKVKHGFNSSVLYNTTLINNSSQGFDIYNNYLVQLYNNTGIQILNFKTGEQISYIPLSSFNHGDTCQFSNEFYDPNDTFPLLYIISDLTPSIVHIVRITDLNNASVIKSYNLGDDAGYYAGQCFDFQNKLIYSFGYKNQDFQTSNNDNKTIISVFDMNQETLINGITYSLECLETYEKDFIYCIQGQKFLNGLCYLVSSYNPRVQQTKIYVYDPIRKLIVAIFDSLPNNILNSETEDIAFIENDNQYDMIIGTRANYTELTFL